MSKRKELSISGFWRRLGALLVDSLILGGLGFLFGIILEKQFVEMGGWGRLLGFAVALIYFGLLNSRLNDGQTVGKAALKLRVVGAEGKCIGVRRSLLRYSVLGVPFFLNNAQFSNEVLFSGWIYLLSLLIFGVGLSTIYLYIFNRETRQSIHDLVLGTFVVSINSPARKVGEIWKPHYGVVAVLFAAAAVVPYFTAKLAFEQPFSEMLKVRTAVMALPVVKYVLVNEGSGSSIPNQDGAGSYSYVGVQAFLHQDETDDQELAMRIGRLTIDAHSGAASKSAIHVVLIYGYDVGIWSQWRSQAHNFNPQQLLGK